MKSILPLLLLVFIAAVKGIAQQSYYNQQPEFLNANKTWAFSHQAGLDFNSGTAVAIQTAIPSTPNRQGEGTSAVSDPQTGELLFYSDGAQCWNATGQIMRNGDSLWGNSSNYWNNPVTEVTTKQGSCIVPYPGQPGKYFLFSLSYSGQVNLNNGLFYNVVDMSLENGTGDIVTGQKNVLLDSTLLSEAMIAIPGNNCDIWLVVHNAVFGDSANNALRMYKAYHITGDGIEQTPVISYGKINGWAGSMAVSPDRSRLAFVSVSPEMFYNGIKMGGVEISEFNASTGLVSDPIEIFSNELGSQGCAFSPDNNKLYIDHFSPTNATTLLQYDIGVFDSLSIENSKQTISSISTAYGASLRLYNDTIYVAGFATASLGTISQPNNAGVACDFQNGTISLLAGTSSAMACLPTEVVIPGKPDTSPSLVLDTLICSGWSTGFTLNPSKVYSDYTYEWQDQSTDTLLNITEAGSYWVRYTNGCHTYIDSFILAGEEFTFPVIRVNEFELSTTVSYDNYQWLFEGALLAGETNPALTVSENGDYQVIATNESGCMDTSDIYTVENAGIHNAHPLASKISVYPNPTKDIVFIQAPVPVSLKLMSIEGRLLKSGHKKNQIVITSLQTGIYLLQVSDEKGMLIKTVKVIKNP